MKEIWALTYDEGLYLFTTVDAVFDSVRMLYPNAELKMSNDEHFAIVEVSLDDHIQDRIYARNLKVYDKGTSIYSRAGDNKAATAAPVSADEGVRR